MQPLTVSEARARFGSVTRGVLKSRKPVVVRTPAGMIQIAPYEVVKKLSSSRRKRLKLLPQEIALHNTFGESL